MAGKIPDLSIIILNYNVRELLLKCLDSVFSNQTADLRYQVIVVDNASSDQSVEAVRDKFPDVELVVNKENRGFSGGNNDGAKKAKAQTILFLNPDTLVVDDVIQKSYQLLHSKEDIGAVTCRVELPDHSGLDYSAHRGFPTPLNSLFYFTGLSKLFPKSKFFSGYTATYLPLDTTHQIDCVSGVFLMVKREVAEKFNFWDEDYFWNGEDIEFCYQIKQTGFKIYYLYDKKIIHYKGSSSGLWGTAKVSVPKERRVKAAAAASKAMKIFYMKHYYKDYPPIMRDLILLGINLLQWTRLLKINLGLRYK